MKVRMLISVSGQRNGLTYPPAGGVMELPERDEAFDLLVNGYAERIEEVEVAMIAPPETASLRTTRPKPRAAK